MGDDKLDFDAIAESLRSMHEDPDAESLVCKFCDLWVPRDELQETRERHHPCANAGRWPRGDA